MQCQHGSKSSGFLTLLKRYLPLNLIYYPYILIQPDLVSLYSNPSQTDNQVTPRLYLFHISLALCYTVCTNSIAYLLLSAHTMEKVQTHTQNHSTPRNNNMN